MGDRREFMFRHTHPHNRLRVIKWHRGWYFRGTTRRKYLLLRWCDAEVFSRLRVRLLFFAFIVQQEEDGWFEEHYLTATTTLDRGFRIASS